MSVIASVSQRIPDQLGVIGLMTKGATENSTRNSAWFEFSGTDNTKLFCKSSLNSSEEITTVTLPGGYTTEQIHRYRVEISHEYVQFSIEGVVVATHFNMVPDPYAILNLFVGWVNDSTLSSSSNIIVDTVFISNPNILQIQSGFTGLPFRVEAAATEKLAQTNANSLSAILVPIHNVLNYKTISVQLTGTWNGRIEFMASNDGLNYETIGSVNLNTNVFNFYVTTNGIYQIPNPGFSFFKAVVTAYNSGTIYADTTLNISSLPIPSSSPIVAIHDPQNHKDIHITSNRELIKTEVIRITGTSFNGSTLDTNFWSSTTLNGGSNITNSGELINSSGTSSGASAIIKSVNVGRYKAGIQNIYRSHVRVSEGVQNNIRQFGVADLNNDNAFFFYLNGTEFGIEQKKDSINTLIPNGSFNGNLGNTYILDTNYHTFEIIYENATTEFYIDGILLHTITSITSSLLSTLNLFITYLNLNLSLTSVSSIIYSTQSTIHSLSAQDTQPLSAVIESNGTFTLKLGAGKLKKIINLDNIGQIILYDNTAGSGTKLLPTMDCARVTGSIDCNTTFNNGLTVVASGTPKILIQYE